MDLDFAVLADAVEPHPDGKLDIIGAGYDTVFAAAVPVRHEHPVLAVRVLPFEVEHHADADLASGVPCTAAAPLSSASSDA